MLDAVIRPRLLAGVLLAALASPVAMAQDAPVVPGKAQAGSSELAKVRQKAQRLQKQVRDLQSKALENHPELRDRRKALKQRVRKKMAEQGFPAKKRKRLNQLRGSLGQGKGQGQGSGGGDRGKRIKELRTLITAQSQAQRKAMQAPKIRKAREAFRKDLMATMKKQDTKAPRLVKQLREVAKKYRRLSRQKAESPGAKAGQSGFS